MVSCSQGKTHYEHAIMQRCEVCSDAFVEQHSTCGQSQLGRGANMKCGSYLFLLHTRLLCLCLKRQLHAGRKSHSAAGEITHNAKKMPLRLPVSSAMLSLHS